MRKITKNAVNAFECARTFDESNTRVENENGVTKLILHGNLIAKKENGELWITSAGWTTNVTRERLNGLEGVSITQKKWVWYLNGKEWDGSWIKVN